MTDQDFLQFLLDKLNEGYEEYKKNHPDFAKVAEQQEGKPEGQKETLCESCGSWLQGFDMCDECGRINK